MTVYAASLASCFLIARTNRESGALCCCCGRCMMRVEMACLEESSLGRLNQFVALSKSMSQASVDLGSCDG